MVSVENSRKRFSENNSILNLVIKIHNYIIKLLYIIIYFPNLNKTLKYIMNNNINNNILNTAPKAYCSKFFFEFFDPMYYINSPPTKVTQLHRGINIRRSTIKHQKSLYKWHVKISIGKSTSMAILDNRICIGTCNMISISINQAMDRPK